MNGLLTILAALALALSIASHATAAKDAKSTVTPIVKTDLRLLSPATLGGTDLKPGEYSVTANDTHAKFLKNGKVIAEASVQWKDESAKAQSTAVVVDGNQIKEIHFSGKMKYVEITQ
jgi:inosine/xanthosine triphosphate pyrophosphatase family protein